MATVWHGNGVALCDGCGDNLDASEVGDVDREGFQAHEAEAENVGSTCDMCRACLVATSNDTNEAEWMTHDEATGPSVLWLVCKSCNHYYSTTDTHGIGEVTCASCRKRPMALPELNTFTRSYLETALWSSTWSDEPNEPNPATLDSQGYGINDFAPEALAQAILDCAAFQATHDDDLQRYDDAHAGHDFWLTRNGHGAGFWDGDYAEPEATRLTEAAHAFGEVDLYVNDDGKVAI